LFPAHYRVGDSLRFLLIAPAGSSNTGFDNKRTAFAIATILCTAN
jgi:hypothetical protein